MEEDDLTFSPFEYRPWRDRAACIGVPPSVFFPEDSNGVPRAKAICKDCDVRAECLEEALETRVPFGIYGGYTEQERRALGGRAAHGTRAMRTICSCNVCYPEGT